MTHDSIANDALRSATGTQYGFAAICLVTLTVGVVLQFRGTASERFRVLPESVASMAHALAPDGVKHTSHKLLVTFERELVSDWGEIQSRVGSLLISSSVIASLAVDFPSQWIVGLALYGASLFVVALAGWCGVTAMVGKSGRHQRLFDRTTVDVADREGLLREFSERHGRFTTWHNLPHIRKIAIVIREARHTAKWYVSNEV